ncbi:hypothetical protein T265_05893 [Opisthorchis viverrini]|uniref:Uncharacterized protein n=1 Tax=Opisthorchis viverrini TaxID=6198 RepID=A0A074ZMJ7_OPIVI|nr:hypothetical protein T265_05893 [Opisthorchis viverrini]KER26987.1 hypothetical protein T265_05893 [Opisthorchis viverrini]
MHSSFSNPHLAPRGGPLILLDLCTNLSSPACNAQLPTPPQSSVDEIAVVQALYDEYAVITADDYEILGRQGGKPEDVYDSHQSLASRIVKIEHKVDAIDVKIDRLVSLCRTDRSGFHHLGTSNHRRLPAPPDTFSHYLHPKCDDLEDQLQPLNETVDPVLHSAKIPDTQTNLPPGFHPAPLVTRFVVPKEQRSESIDTTVTEYKNPETSSTVCVEEVSPQPEAPSHHVLRQCTSLPPATQPIITASDAVGSQHLVAAHGPSTTRMVRSEHHPGVSQATGETSPSWRSTDCLPRTTATECAAPGRLMFQSLRYLKYRDTCIFVYEAATCCILRRRCLSLINADSRCLGLVQGCDALHIEGALSIWLTSSAPESLGRFWAFCGCFQEADLPDTNHNNSIHLLLVQKIWQKSNSAQGNYLLATRSPLIGRAFFPKFAPDGFRRLQQSSAAQVYTSRSMKR